MALHKESSLYHRDYYAWVRDQVDALRQHRIEDVDWENVAEEIEDLGKSQRHALESQLTRLIEHLLKLEHASDASKANNARGWQLTIADSRLVVHTRLDQNPSLRPELPEMLSLVYRRGRLAALRKAKLADRAIPAGCPWTLDQILDDEFLPGGVPQSP